MDREGLASETNRESSPALAPPPSHVLFGWPAPVHWSAAQILLIVFLAPVWFSLCHEAFHALGIYRALYGPELVALARDTSPGVNVEARQLAQLRLVLWAGPPTFLLQLGSTLLVLYVLSGTRPREVGLSRHRLGTNLLAGALAALALTPGVYGLNALVVLLHGDSAIQEHSFTRLGQVRLAPSEWALFVFAAVIAAPVWEELLVRGILQPWFATRRWGAHLAMALAFGIALVTRADVIRAAFDRSAAAVIRECVPALCVLGLVPVYLLVCWRARSSVGPTLFATAVLFGWAHARVWPSPVPLVLLGLGLGYLAYRTQSIVGPIVLHALFNATACAALIVKVVLQSPPD